jgi:hypothetical protein
MQSEQDFFGVLVGFLAISNSFQSLAAAQAQMLKPRKDDFPRNLAVQHLPDPLRFGAVLTGGWFGVLGSFSCFFKRGHDRPPRTSSPPKLSFDASCNMRKREKIRWRDNFSACIPATMFSAYNGGTPYSL